MMSNTRQPDVLLKEGERLDDLQRNGYMLIQHPKRFCFGMDAVLLTDFVKVKPGERVLDLGTGTGVIPILLAAKTRGAHFTGLEIQEESADMARRSVSYNGLEDKVEIVTGDICQASSLFAAQPIHVITVNPPYMRVAQGLHNEETSRQIARHEILCRLEDILRESGKLLEESKGRFYMVHRPFRLTEIFSLMTKYKLEPKRLQFVHASYNKEPAMVLVEGVKGARPDLRVEPPLILSEQGLS